MLDRTLGFAAVLVLAATSIDTHAQRGQPAGPPSLSDLQMAYESEATGSNSKKHDTGLKLWETTCRHAKGSAYACSVSFYSAKDPEQTLYMDIALVEPGNSGWRLKSGLCRK